MTEEQTTLVISPVMKAGVVLGYEINAKGHVWHERWYRWIWKIKQRRIDGVLHETFEAASTARAAMKEDPK